jgi:S1-C subfamily serine protease
VPAKVIGFDPNSDVALLKIDPKGLDLVPLRLARSGADVLVGEPVAAIGSPFGEKQSLSVGVVSAKQRTI